MIAEHAVDETVVDAVLSASRSFPDWAAPADVDVTVVRPLWASPRRGQDGHRRGAPGRPGGKR